MTTTSADLTTAEQPTEAPLLKDLFPRPVGAADLIGTSRPELPWPGEAQAVERAVAARVAEFAAGRACARLAMAQLGLAPVAVLARSDRAPAWPAGVVGSITHTRGYCAAVVASAASYRGIGIDAEREGSVEADLWGRLFLPVELRWIESLAEPDRARAATLLFCAKEAFYKSQHPSTGRWLEFTDVVVEIEGTARQPSGAALGYRISVRTPPADASLPMAGQGRYRYAAGFVIASAWLD